MPDDDLWYLLKVRCMRPTRIVLAVNVLDNADILHEYISWYLSLGVDFILAYDSGSSDGSQDILEQFAKRKLLKWELNRKKNIKHYDPSAELTRRARDEYNADWVILCDTDEFLCTQENSVRGLLEEAEKQDLTVLNVGCFNMTGPPPKPGDSAPQNFNLRIDRTVKETYEQQLSGNLPVPYIFIGHPPKTIVRTSSFVEYGPGAHSAASSAGKTGEASQLRFLHYPIRGFDAFDTKVRNFTIWLDENKHLEAWWGWHWRRWIRLKKEGRLREDYENQFVTAARAQELIRDGVCSIDETVMNWAKRNQKWTARLRRQVQKIIPPRLFV
jgi:hypothetical protein